jgi:arylsulfatase A-like enzyme
MTGKYPVRKDCTDWFGARRAERFRPAPLHECLDLDEITLGEAFQEAGYRTVFVGKWHLGPNAEFWPEHQGFNFNIGGCHLGHPPSYFAPYKNPRLTDGDQGEFLTERLTNEAIGKIKELKNSPFFLYLSFYQVHTPLQAPESIVQKYRNKSKRLGLPTEHKELFESEEQNYLSDDPRLIRQRQTHPVYAAMVESMDTAVGRVMATLQEENLLDNTILCFLSDNGGLASASEGGPTSNAPFRAGKGWQYEGGLRIPFIIRTPNGISQLSEFPVITTDIYPTLLELSEIPLKPQQHLDGVSLKTILEGKEPPKRDALYWHYPHYGNQGGFPSGAIRESDWKLIRRYESGRVQLYNLKNDPSEQTDLSEKEPKRAKQLADKHDRWLQSVNAKFLREKNGNIPWKPDYLQ